MTRLTRLLTILTILIGFDMLVGCCDCDNEEPITFPQYTCDMTAINLDNSQEDISVQFVDSIPATAYGIRVEVIHNNEVCHWRAPRARFLSSSAMAFSCDCYDALTMPMDTIVGFHVYSDSTFSETILAGDEITHLFRYRTGGEFLPLLETTSTLGVDESNSNTLSFSDILLFTAPEEAGVYSFNVELEMMDGRIFSQHTDPVRLWK